MAFKAMTWTNGALTPASNPTNPTLTDVLIRDSFCQGTVAPGSATANFANAGYGVSITGSPTC